MSFNEEPSISRLEHLADQLSRDVEESNFTREDLEEAIEELRIEESK